MTETRFDLNWRLFADPPDEPETQYGAMLVNYSGNTARDTYDMVTSYRAAAFRLLDAAMKHGEAWESVDPILFCFRHALELNLKSLHTGARLRTHGLKPMADALHERLSSRYPTVQVNWLRDRIHEFDTVDPRSTAFRYDDAASPATPPELWVDFAKLRHIMNTMFDALDTVRRHDFELERERA
ncbi:hypothetical protein [Shinella zoogloeoides]|uniref:hypothetical protein n=1 Tax=Shinella zoogloeoides TaxID=352475 RepID=UPI001F5626D1|nr:hypothetical protein [Shinella zoogloeoides]